MLLPATCMGWRVRSGGAGPNQNQKTKSKETEADEPFPTKKTRSWGSSCVVMKSMRRTTRNKIKANVPWLQGNDNHGGDSYGRNMLMMKKTKTKIGTSMT
jgi:hypothetical protein